jgi:hypothetical protein
MSNQGAVNYTGSTLWQSAFNSSPKRDSNRIHQFYEGQLLNLRRKVGVLLDRIKADLPNLTIHDLSHLDALWELSSLIAGKGIKLSPSEGFVFGAAILLHDAAMSVTAFEGKLTEIKRTTEWRDSVAMLIQSRENRSPSPDEILEPPREIEEIALPQVLRALHAVHAERLPKMSWRNLAGEQEYLIDHAELRTFFGSIVGKIARSHGEPMSYIEAALREKLGPCPSRDGGPVDGLKLACLLRCADAAHIDSRRAPQFTEAILKPAGEPHLHWSFQGRLAKAQLIEEAIVFSAASPFSLKEADAWWLCYDAIRNVDRELRSCDSFLELCGRDRFAARYARGADSPRALIRDVPTEGWDPIDAHVKVTDVRRLVRMFGGEKLYGDKASVVIRELLQNSADAIRARRRLAEPEERYVGEITIALEDDEEGTWLVVSDDGIGMSSRTMTETLLDFGTSFWSSELAQREFPGLMSSGFSAVGKFGIGFFSVFMVADVVRVTSRRFDAGQAQTRTLEFRSGLELRPILRTAGPGETVAANGGTKIRLKLKSDPYEKGGILHKKEAWGGDKKVELGRLASYLCPNLDVAVNLSRNCKRTSLIKPEDWKRLSGGNYLSRIHGYESDKNDDLYALFLRPIKYKGKTFGRACIRADAYWRSLGRVSVQGFAVGELDYVDGTFDGIVENLARDQAKVIVPVEALREWAQEQADLIAASELPNSEKMDCAGVVLACGADPNELPICKFQGKFLSAAALARRLKGSRFDKLIVHEGEPSFEDYDNCHPRDFANFVADQNVIILGMLRGASYKHFWWGANPSYWPTFCKALDACWKTWYEEDESHENVRIGEANLESIDRPVRVVKRIRRK